MFRIRRSISRISCRPRAVIEPWTQARSASIKHGRGRGREKGQMGHWTDEKMQTSEKYPLSVALADVIHPNLEPKWKGRRDGHVPSLSGIHVRTQIVSPDLCDDVVKYIGPTLEKHKGCDILDINPGAGLWSQKLHDFLQPRSHVLLEPRPEKFRDFLDPLLTAPDSKYSLIAKDPSDLQTYRALVAESVFPHQTRLDTQDPKAQEPNNTLLVTGSLVWDPRLPGHAFDSMAKQLFHHFASAAWSNDLFHSFGLVRTLFWVQHDDFSPMIANSVIGMQKANCFLEMTHNMSVVVNAERTGRKLGNGSSGREPQYEIESTVRALQAGREKGMKIPPHRRDHIYDFATDIEKLSNGTGISSSASIQDYLGKQEWAGKSTIGLLQESFIEYYAMEKSIRSDYPDLILGRVPSASGAKTARSVNLNEHPDAERILAAKKKGAQVLNMQRIKAQIEAITDVGEEMYLLECRVLEMRDGSEKDAAMKKLDELDEAVQRGIEKLSINYKSSVLSEIDDRIAMRAAPYPRLQWDRRPFEPLIMRPKETWPQNRLSLISSEPISRPTAQTPDWYEWIMDFVFGLYATPSMPINQSLDKMQHGLNDIIKDCPSLKDPKKGGRLNMNHLRVRLLTVEMIEELVTAYKDWPFKAPGSDHNKYFRHKGATQGFVGGRLPG